MTGSCVTKIAPLGVIDGLEVMVGTPLGFAESNVASENDPVSNGSDERVARCMMGKASYVVEHAVGDHLLSFGYCLVFLDSVSHYFNVI